MIAPANLGQRQLVGAGRYTISAGTLTSVVRTGLGIPARTGAGVVTLTTSQDIAAAERQAVCSQEQAGSAPTIAYTSATVTTVSTFAVDGTTATDKNMSWELWQFVPGAFTQG